MLVILSIVKYKSPEENLSPSFQFTVVEITSKTWFYALWTPVEWLTGEVRPLDQVF